MADFLSALSSQFAQRGATAGGLGNILLGAPAMMKAQDQAEQADAKRREFQSAFQQALTANNGDAAAAIAQVIQTPAGTALWESKDTQEAVKMVTDILRPAAAPETTPQQKNLAGFQDMFPDIPISPDLAAQALGITPAPPDKLQIAADLERQLGRPPTESELQTYFGLVQTPQVGVTVQGPDLGPVFNLVTAQQRGEEARKINEINLAASNVQELLDFTNQPNANMLFGPAGKGFALTAPFAELFGAKRAGFVFGPSITDLASARASAAANLADAARTVIDQGGRNLSKRELEIAGSVLANPEGFLTGASQVREAATLFQRRLQQIQTQTAGTLSAGGTTPQPGTVNPLNDPVVKKRVMDRTRALLEEAGVAPEKATDEQHSDALDKALTEILGQTK